MSAGTCRPSPVWRCSLLYQPKKVWQCRRAASTELNQSGKSGRYFSVLNCASLNGLSSDTCGRECDWVTPRSAWMVNWSRPIPCLAQVWRISTSARAADSRSDHPSDHVAGEDVQDHVQV